MARQLFGTDGIRGVAGEYPLDRATARAVGSALGAWILDTGQPHEVVIGMDTRESGSWLAAEVAAYLAEACQGDAELPYPIEHLAPTLGQHNEEI